MDSLERKQIKKEVIVLDPKAMSSEKFSDFIKEIKILDDGLVPKKMRFPIKELKSFFLNEKGVHLVIKDIQGKITGYLTSVPHNEELENFKEQDRLFSEDDEALYIESVAIKKGELPTLNNIFKTLTEESSKKGYKKITMHARASEGNNLSRSLVERYHFKPLRTIQNWYGYGEPFDYLEFELPEVSSKER